MKHLEDATVVSNTEIRPGIWSMWLTAPHICGESSPGQFVHVKVPGDHAPLLRRPLSIGRVTEDRLELVWRVIGEGTRQLAAAMPGWTVNLFGPLGRPFSMPAQAERFLLVGGGLGLPPLVYLSETLRNRGRSVELLLGVRGQNDIPLADDDPVLARTTITAENGEGFRQGLVTEPALELLAGWQSSPGLDRVALYSCGPWGLVNALQRLLPHDRLLLAEVSLEQQMGCANGVCQGCAVLADGGDTPYRLVCHDGPVFPLGAVHSPLTD